MTAAMTIPTLGHVIAQIADCSVEHDVLLAPMTTFRIGGPAEWLVSPRSSAAVCEVAKVATRYGVPLWVLGGGTNIVISDRGLPGVVLTLSPGFDFLRETPRPEGGARWHVGAGCSTGKVVRRGIVRGLLGPEVLAGVPGSIGGAVVMNAGGHRGELGDIVRRVEVVRGGRVAWLEHAEVGFAYRHTELGRDVIVLSAELELAPGDSTQLQELVRGAQARRRATQPLGVPNAGSVFKNPADDFAGRLIEAAGCKGWREGGAEVSERHANFIVNRGGATAFDVAKLARRVQTAVAERSGVRLELEVKFLGDVGEGERP